MIRCVLLSFILSISVLLDASADNMPASKSPPGNLSPQRVPQFVNIGFDDNGYTDGMEWILDYLRDKTNPQGINNPSTYDGTPARGIFYLTTYYANDTTSPGLKEAWIKAYEDGHEIGNHTVSHYEAMAGWTQAQWEAELDSASNWMVENIGIPKNEIWGFRTPFLAFSYMGYTHYAIKALGLIYDCSLNAGSEIIGDGSDFYWPYTMDEGSPDEHYIKAVPGLWQVPVHYVMVAGGGRMTGFDYNLWAMLDQSKSSFVATVKQTLDLRYNGNRAPFCFGGHTDYYSEFNESANDECNGATWQQRREAVEEFIDYALQKPDVRFVSSKDIIRWMRSPVGLDATTADNTSKTMITKPPAIETVSRANIRIFIPEAGTYSLSIYAASGRKVATLSHCYFSRGSHTITPKNHHHAHGVYYLRLHGSTGEAVEKIVVSGE